MPQHLFSYWDGPISWLERLSVATALEQGHTLTIYSYNPEELLKTGIHSDVRDANEIIPNSNVSYRYIVARRFTLFTNIFRLVAQMEEIGIWIDLDCIFEKPLELKDEYLFGWLSPIKLNGAVLRLPKDASMTKDYHKGISAIPLRTPWSTPRRRIQREVEIAIGKDMPSIKTRTNIGPRALTYYAKRHKVIDHAQPKDFFYPLRSGLAGLLAIPDDREARASISERTIIMHSWQGRLKREGYIKAGPAETSYLGQLCKKFHINGKH